MCFSYLRKKKVSVLRFFFFSVFRYFFTMTPDRLLQNKKVGPRTGTKLVIHSSEKAKGNRYLETKKMKRLSFATLKINLIAVVSGALAAQDAPAQLRTLSSRLGCPLRMPPFSYGGSSGRSERCTRGADCAEVEISQIMSYVHDTHAVSLLSKKINSEGKEAKRLAESKRQAEVEERRRLQLARLGKKIEAAGLLQPGQHVVFDYFNPDDESIASSDSENEETNYYV